MYQIVLCPGVRVSWPTLLGWCHRARQLNLPVASDPYCGSPPGDSGIQLEESLKYLQFMENAEEEEAWISEKEAMVARGDSGDTLAATQVRKRSLDQVSSLSFVSFHK